MYGSIFIKSTYEYVYVYVIVKYNINAVNELYRNIVYVCMYACVLLLQYYGIKC